MTVQATFLKGNPEPVDYTPGADVAAGDVVVVGETPLISHRAIKSGVLGALMAFGGVYSALADGAITAGAAVYWDNTAKKVTVTAAAGANKHIGFLVPGSTAAANNDTVYFHHRPSRAGI